MKKFFLILAILTSIFSFSQSPISVDSIVNEINHQKSSSTITYGSNSQFHVNVNTEVQAVALSETKFVVAFRDNTQVNNMPTLKGMLRIGEVSGSTITWGSIYTFNNAETQSISIEALDEEHFIIAYEDISNLLYGTVRIGTVSGASVSLGSEQVFSEAQTTTICVKKTSSNNIVIVYNSNSSANSVVGVIEGESITFGASNMIHSSSVGYSSLLVLSSYKVVVSYRASTGYSRVGIISGSNISWGSASQFNNATTFDISSSPLTDSKFIVAYSDFGNSSKGTAVVGSVTGSTISFSSESIFNNYKTERISVMNLDESNFLIAFYEYDGNLKGSSIIGQYNNSGLSWGTIYSYLNGARAYSNSIFKFKLDKIGVAYYNLSNDYGYAVIGDIGGAVITWTGASNTDWNNGNNWTASIPTIFDNVLIAPSSNQPVIGPASSASCKVLTINESATLTIESTSSGTGSLITNSSVNNNGAINIQRYISNDDWHLLASPIGNVTAGVFIGHNLQCFDEPSGSYQNIVDENTNLIPVKGYSLWASSSKASTFTFTGTPNNGNQSINVTYTENGSSFKGANLVGNPYPSYIDWNDFDDSWGAIYYWDGVADDFVEWNNGQGSGSKYIPPMQAFFIITDSDKTFTLTNEDRAHSGGGNYFKSDISSMHNIVLYTQNSNKDDELFIQFNDFASASFDKKYDAYKLVSTYEGNSQLYSIYDETNFSIDVRPFSNVIQLGFQNDVAGIYQIGVREFEGFSLIIEDTKTNWFHDLSKGPYEFIWDNSDSEKRFKLLHKAIGISEEYVEEKARIYIYDDRLIISSPSSLNNAKIRVFDMMGRLVFEENVDESDKMEYALNLSGGAYIVAINSEELNQNEKIIIQ